MRRLHRRHVWRQRMFSLFASKNAGSGANKKLLDLQYRDIVPEDYDLLLTLDDGVKRQTLRPSDVARLPLVNFLTCNAKNYHGQDTCLVCMEAIAKGTWVRQLPGCGHVFHKECIGKWLTERAKVCPVDKTEVRPLR